TVTDFPPFTPVQTIEVFPLPTLPETIAPSPPGIVPAGPVVLLNETVEGETGSWHFSGGWGRSNLEEAHTGDWSFSDSPGTFYTPGTTSTLSLAQPLSLPPGTRIQLQYWQRVDLAAGDSVLAQ